MPANSNANTQTQNNSNNNNNNNTSKNKDEKNDKYLARTKDGRPNPKKEEYNGKNLNKDQEASNKDTSNKGENNKKQQKNGNNNPKDDMKTKAKEQAASTAMTALGVPAPLAKALAKPAVNKLDNKKGLLNEQQQIKQGQERLDNIRNLAGALNESKKQKEENEEAEEEQPASLIDQAEDIKAKAENISGFVKFIKMIPAPAWGIIGCMVALFFLFIVFFSSIQSTTIYASIMEDYLKDVGDKATNNSPPPTNTPNQGTGKLGYPTDSRTISAGFPNYSSGAYHGGIDFPVSTGSNVYAAEAGEVIVKKELGYSYGYYLYIKHDNGLCTLYAHNSELLVNEGDKVTKGQIIAKSGSTGNSTGPHCHFEVRTDCGVSVGAPSGTRVNPNDYLSE